LNRPGSKAAKDSDSYSDDAGEEKFEEEDPDADAKLDKIRD
jgi:hypothetical protein